MTTEEKKARLADIGREKEELIISLFHDLISDFSEEIQDDLARLTNNGKALSYISQDRHSGITIEMRESITGLERVLSELGLERTEKSPCSSFWKKGTFFASPYFDRVDTFPTQPVAILIGNLHK